MEGCESPPRAATTLSTAPPASGGVPSMRHHVPPQPSVVKPPRATTSSSTWTVGASSTTRVDGGENPSRRDRQRGDREVEIAEGVANGIGDGAAQSGITAFTEPTQ